MEPITTLITGEFDASPETRAAYSHDASIFQVTPEAVLYPRSIEDLQKLLAHVTDRKKSGVNVSLTPRNGGTCMSGGSLTESYVLDMTRHFGWLHEIDFNHATIKVGGGTMHLEVEKATHPHKLLFPPYTSSHDICGIGGMIGNNASGEKSVKYGATDKSIADLTVVLTNGEVCTFGPITPEELEVKKQAYTLEGHLYREVSRILDEHAATIAKHPKLKKNAAGYALWEVWNEDHTLFNLGRLIIGSQGTLALVTEATLKLIPMNAHRTMLLVPIEHLSQLAGTVHTLLAADPDTCETYDHHTYELAEKLHPTEAGAASTAKGKHMVVFAVYEGVTRAEVTKKVEQATAAITALGGETFVSSDEQVIEANLFIRRKSFKMLLENPTPNYRAMAFLEDTIVPLTHYGEFLAALEAILSEYNMTYTYAGHIGDGSIRLVPLMNVEQPDAAGQIIELLRRVNDLVFAFGGSMSVDHNDGIIRTPFLERMYGPEMTALFAEVKHLFDPEGILNPGKKVGGSLEYTKNHIVTKNS
jgi:FAD/FMN-containing dehydrogenase